eukprot:CAMPEP_0205829446 /NCGR_PEP_ID=MMETSP0206-20130828/38137_1 /ASSEMBLY_ACC=CAM_ASM_000279 /TAXON_ID=36767 /ORGANISM="Euplotes focardii, Strain TN1" /LENGTH=204 /DNA_ID=CAMNT_0053132173 /DNA_START=14 /DNA_END=625 /DNA_ORIENTATION=+
MTTRLSRADTLSRTGSSITHGALSPISKSRNPLLPKKANTNISIKEMTGVSDLNFGIQGYTIPKHFIQQPSAPKFTIPKEDSKRYFDIIAQRSAEIPEPGRYNKSMVWKGKFGVMKGGKRETFLDNIMKHTAKLPAPNQYSPLKKIQNKQGKFDKSDRGSFLDDACYLAEKVPQSTLADKNIVLKKVSSVKILPPKKNDQPGSW